LDKKKVDFLFLCPAQSNTDTGIPILIYTPTYIMDSQTEASRQTRNGGSTGIDDRVWVACNKCDKWRALPSTVDSKALPDIWVCSDNHYDPTHASCDVPEETFKQSDAETKDFFKVWSKRLKNTDKAEQRLPPSAITRGRKRRLDIEWIQCSKPSCGKWRAISLRGLDTNSMLRKLSRNPRGGWHTREIEWYCSMNSWDETKAACSAPQEPLWDCRWNLGA
jgi:hypothetical protein